VLIEANREEQPQIFRFAQDDKALGGRLKMQTPVPPLRFASVGMVLAARADRKA